MPSGGLITKSSPGLKALSSESVTMTAISINASWSISRPVISQSIHTIGLGAGVADFTLTPNILVPSNGLSRQSYRFTRIRGGGEAERPHGLSRLPNNRY